MWTDLDWLRLEGMLYQPTRPSAREMSEALGITRSIIEQTIFGWYGKKVAGKKGTKSDPEAKVRRKFIEDNLDMSNAEVCEHFEALGLTCTSSSVRNMRAKILRSTRAETHAA